MKVILNIEKRYAYIISFILIILIGIVAVNAYGGTSPTSLGHTAGEINVMVNGQPVTLTTYIDNKINEKLNNNQQYAHTHITEQIVHLPRLDDGGYGEQITLEQYINNLIQGSQSQFSCESTPIYNSMDSGISYRSNNPTSNYASGIKSIPDSCKTDAGCIIKQEVYDTKGLKMTRFYGFVQDPSNKWWSSYRTLGLYVNGDTRYIDIIPAYGGLYVRDDYVYSTYINEKDSTKMTFLDLSASYGMKVYICSDN